MAKNRDDAPLPDENDDLDFLSDLGAEEGKQSASKDDDHVDLSGSAGVEPSDVSMVEWASLLEEPAPAEEGEPIVEIPSDSAVDLGAPISAEDDLLLPPASSAVLNEDAGGMFLEDELTPAAPTEEPGLFATPEEEVEFDAPALPNLPDVTGVNLMDEDDEILEPEVMTETSAVNLAGEEILDPEIVESSSGISIHDLGMEEVPADEVDHFVGEEIFENSGELVLEEIVQQEAGAVDLGEEVLLGAESPSQRDLIAEAVESGVELPDVARQMMEAGENSHDSEVQFGETTELPVNRDDELMQLMDDLAASDNHPALPSSDEEVATTELLDEQPPTEETETIAFEADRSAEDEILKTGGRIAPPDSLAELEWDGAVGSDASQIHLEQVESSEEAGMEPDVETTVDESGFDESAFEEEFRVEEEPVEEEPEAPPVAVGKKGKKIPAKTAPDAGDTAAGKKPVKPRSSAGAWLGGTFLGVLLGAGGVIGTSLSGYDPIPAVGTTVGIPVNERREAPKPPPPPTFDDLAVALKNGDFEQANQMAGRVENRPAEKPEDRALLGQFRFQNHLQKQALVGSTIKPDDDAIKQAVTDLQAVETPEAMLTLAQIQMTTGDLAAAEKTLKDAGAKFQDRRVTAAQIRLELLKEEKTAVPAPAPNPAPVPAPAPNPVPAPQPQPNEPQAREDAVPFTPLLLGLFVAIQPEPMPMPMPPMPMPIPPVPAAPAEMPEAGFEFWQAVKLAREQKFTEARAALAKAIEFHEKRRFARLNKAQNPDSDPAEEIFLRACKELQMAWDAQENLNKKGYLVERGDPRKAVEAVLKDAADGKKTAQMMMQVGTKLADAKLIDNANDLVAGADRIIADRKLDFEKITKLEKDYADAKKTNETLTLEVAAAKKFGEDVLAKLNTTEKQLVEATKNLTEKSSVVDVAGKMLTEAKVTPEKPDHGQFLKGVQEVIKTAEMKDPGSVMRMLTKDLGDLKQKYDRDTADLKADKVKSLSDQKAAHDKVVIDLKDGHQKEVTDLKSNHLKEVTDLKTAHTKQVDGLNLIIKESRRAAEVLPSHLRALQERGTGLEDTALEDVARVGRDMMATPVEKAQADVIRGQVLRNRNMFAESKESLEKGLPGLPKESPFVRIGERLREEVTDPAAFVGRQIQEYQSRGQTGEALQLLQTSLEFLPAESRPALLAQRALLQLDELRRKTGGRFPLTDPAYLAAQKDATDAEMAGTSEGSFAAGRLAEETGQFNLAIEKFREAVKRHGKEDAVGTRYRVALARALVQVSQPWTPPAGNPKKPAPAADGEGKTSRIEAPGLQQMLLLMMIGLQPGELLGSPNRAEAQRLADEILALGDKAPFDVRAQALAIKGRWTEALTTYAEGLRGVLKGDLSEGLLLLIRNHPALKKDDSDRIDPVEAERLFGQGVRLYFLCDHAEAEKLFVRALEANDQDARIFYFLGLSRLAQRKQDLAYSSFESGAQLERQNKPSRNMINASLERVQGIERRVLGQIRDRVER